MWAFLRVLRHIFRHNFKKSSKEQESCKRQKKKDVVRCQALSLSPVFIVCPIKASNYLCEISLKRLFCLCAVPWHSKGFNVLSWIRLFIVDSHKLPSGTEGGAGAPRIVYADCSLKTIFHRLELFFIFNVVSMDIKIPETRHIILLDSTGFSTRLEFVSCFFKSRQVCDDLITPREVAR